MRPTTPIFRKLTPSRTVRDEMAILIDLGFEYGGTTGGHHRWEHPTHGRLRPMSSTPRNEKTWRKAHRAEVAALMGLTLWQLERLIAGQPLTRTGRKRRRHAIRGRAARGPAAIRTVPATEPREQPTLVRPDRTSCVDCGRPWLSDLDYAGRPCPKCGGVVVGGREAA